MDADGNGMKGGRVDRGIGMGIVEGIVEGMEEEGGRVGMEKVEGERWVDDCVKKGAPMFKVWREREKEFMNG